MRAGNKKPYCEDSVFFVKASVPDRSMEEPETPELDGANQPFVVADEDRIIRAGAWKRDKL